MSIPMLYVSMHSNKLIFTATATVNEKKSDGQAPNPTILANYTLPARTGL